jgi:hypothetical protein
LPATHSVNYTITTARVRDAVGTATSLGPTLHHNRLNMQYYNSDNMGQWHCAEIKGNKLLVNPLKHTAVCETAGLAKSVDTQPVVRRLRHRCLLLVILAFCQ